MEIAELLQKYGAYSLERQDALSDFLGAHKWWLDLPAGTVDFGSGRVYAIQLIGTESPADGSWLWAWANSSGNIPESLLLSVKRLREFGEQHAIRAFVEPELELDTVDSHIFGMIASGLSAADAYYVGHHEGGAVLFLVFGPDLKRLVKPSVFRMATIFSTFISGWEVPDQQRAFLAYAEAKGCRTQLSDRRVDCVDPDGEKISADFDDSGRLIRMTAGSGGDKGAS